MQLVLLLCVSLRFSLVSWLLAPIPATLFAIFSYSSFDMFGFFLMLQQRASGFDVQVLKYISLSGVFGSYFVFLFSFLFFLVGIYSFDF